MPFNLSSRNGIFEPCDLADLKGWFGRELTQVPNPSEKTVLKVVANDLDSFCMLGFYGSLALAWL
jgi:hypothetical protein